MLSVLFLVCVYTVAVGVEELRVGWERNGFSACCRLEVVAMTTVSVLRCCC